MNWKDTVKKNQLETSLARELKRGFSSVQRGLSEIDRIRAGNDFYEPTLFFLSIGLERIMKCMFCIEHCRKNGEFPSSKGQPWKNSKKGHDLLFLKNLTISTCGISNLEDHVFVTKSKELQELLSILSAYGTKDRYFDLDEMVGDDSHANENSPTNRFDRFQSELAAMHYGVPIYCMLADLETQGEAFKVMNKATKEISARFIRALSRQFVHMRYGTVWLDPSEYLTPFGELSDNDFARYPNCG